MSLNAKTYAAVATVLLVGSLTRPAGAFAQAGFRDTGDMTFSRSSHAAVVLADGSVLVASDFAAERYDPAADGFTSFIFLTVNHGRGLTATLLADGRVLVVGGSASDNSVAAAEIYDPATGAFSPTGSMATPRSFHTATLLPDGRVLVAGGHQFNFSNSALDTAELYDPGTGSFSPAGRMTVARDTHTATLLPDGRVLVVGGYGSDATGLTGAEIFDAATGAFSMTGSLTWARGDHSASLLVNGTILIAGGHEAIPAQSLDTAEIYSPALGTFSPTGGMTVARGAHAVAPLADGTILVVGGYTAFPFLGVTLDSADIYDPGSGTFAATASMPFPRGRFAAAPLPNGDVLVSGGLDSCCGALSQAEVFTTSLVDTEPPVIFAPGDISSVAYTPEGTSVYFYVTASDAIDANPEVVCTPASGSLFPIGTTAVLCTATDDSANVATATFNVVVFEPVAITVSLDASGTVDPITGIATLSGTVSCTRPTQYFSLFGELSQIVANRATLSGTFFAQTSCVAGAPAVWSATVTASNGRFKAGKADATGSASACDNVGSCGSASAQTGVQLRAKK